MCVQEVGVHLRQHTWTSLNSLACRRSAAFTGSMWRSAATEMDIPSTSVTGSCALACSTHARLQCLPYIISRHMLWPMCTMTDRQLPYKC